MLAERLRGDLITAWKGVRGGRLGSLAAILALGVGIGASVAAGNIAHAGLLRPLPFPDGDSLLTLRREYIATGRIDGIRFAEFEDWRARLQPVGELVAVNESRVSLVDGGTPTDVRAGYVAGRFFEVLAVAARLGRAFSEDDAVDGAVLSDRFARRLASSAELTIGRTVSVGQRPFIVAGVMPPSFGALGDIDVWLPARAAGPTRVGTGDVRPYRMILRLAPAATPAAARLIGQQTLDAMLPENQRGGWRLGLAPLREHLMGDARPLVLVFAAAALLVLLVACANVAMLLVNRAVARSRELAVRMALGASRGRLLTTAVLETSILTLAAAGIGWWIAAAASTWLAAQTGIEVPPLALTSSSSSAMRLAAGVALAMLLAIALCGLAPILAMQPRRLQATLRAPSSTSPRGSRRLRGVLVVAQLAMAVVLLAGTVLLGRTLTMLSGMDLGVDGDPARVVTVRIPIGESPRREPEARLAMIDQMLQQTRRLPGVTTAGLGGGLPPSEAGIAFTIRFTSTDADDTRTFDVVPVTDGYLDALGARLVAGRLFSAADFLTDPATTPLVVISEAALRHLRKTPQIVDAELPMTLPSASGKRVRPRVIGVIRDIRHAGLDTPPHGGIYVMWRHLPLDRAYLAVQAAGDPASVMRSLPPLLRAVEPAIAIGDAWTLDQEIERSLAPRATRAGLVGVFAAAALLLAVVGLSGTLARFVIERQRELAIRSALGASPRTLVAGVVRHAMALTAAGSIAGVAAAIAAGRAASALIFGVTPHDPLTYAATLAAVVTVAFAACYWPARRAAAADPIVLLRGE